MKETIPTSNTTKAKDDSTNTKKTSTATQTELHYYVWVSAAVFVFYNALATAYNIRLIPIKEFGPVIHEFDPYFNYRATEVSAQ
jgi:asparagine N-glycosylation enzyme membrane subunit Stt3